MLDGPTVTSLSFFSKGHLFLICATNQNNPHILKYVSYDRLRLLQPCGKCFSWAPRAANNGRSTDNVRPDRRLDRSNSGLAGHFDRSFLDTNTLFSIQLSLNALQRCNDSFFLWRFLLLCTKPF